MANPWSGSVAINLAGTIAGAHYEDANLDTGGYSRGVIPSGTWEFLSTGFGGQPQPTWTCDRTGIYRFRVAAVAQPLADTPSGYLLSANMGLIHVTSAYADIEALWEQSTFIAAPSSPANYAYTYGCDTLMQCTLGDLVFPAMVDMNPPTEDTTYFTLLSNVSNNQKLTYFFGHSVSGPPH